MIFFRYVLWLVLALCSMVGGVQAESAPADSALPATAEPEERFDILEYRVEGNTVLPAITIEDAVYPFLGEKLSFASVRQASTALEKAYHEAGYLSVVVDIPPQDVKEGVVHLSVVEGQVERLKVSGSRYYSLGRIKSKVPEVAEGSVPHFPTLQQELGELNRNADRRVTPVLRPGRSPGKVEVELGVKDELPLHGNLELNNRNSVNTTQTRLSGSLRYDNLFQREQSLALQFQVAPEKTKESKVFSANYLLPLGRGRALALYAVRSDSDVATDVSVVGNGTVLGARYVYPLRGSNDLFHNLSFGVDYKDFKETVTQLGADANFKTPISYTPLTVAYDATRFGAGRQQQFNVTANFSIRGLGNSAQEFAEKRFNGKPDYAYLRLDYKHTERFGDWTLYGHLGSQLSAAALISNEQFGAGGADTVRGYYETEVLGDRGGFGSFEVRTPKLWGGGFPGPQAIGFFDVAYLEVLDALSTQRPRYHLAGTGLGLRWNAKGFGLNLDWAFALRSASATAAHDTRIHARLIYEF